MIWQVIGPGVSNISISADGKLYETTALPSGAEDGFIAAALDTGLQIQTDVGVHLLPTITNPDPPFGSMGTEVGRTNGQSQSDDAQWKAMNAKVLKENALMHQWKTIATRLEKGERGLMKSTLLGRIVGALALLLICGSIFPQTPGTASNVQPLKVKAGLWQITKTAKWTGLSPQYEPLMKSGRPIKYNSCVKARDLTTNPWANGTEETCVWTVLNSTGTDMEVQGSSCNLGEESGMTAEVHGKIHAVDSEDGTGSFAITVTGNGQTMKGNAIYIGKWVAASCPTGTN